jgi:hypothetical protein
MYYFLVCQGRQITFSYRAEVRSYGSFQLQQRQKSSAESGSKAMPAIIQALIVSHCGLSAITPQPDEYARDLLHLGCSCSVANYQ